MKVPGAGCERLNISLPKATVKLLDRVTPRGSRSRFIDEAIRERVATVGRKRLRNQLERGYAARASRDLEIADEWFVVDEAVWERPEHVRERK